MGDADNWKDGQSDGHDIDHVDATCLVITPSTAALADRPSAHPELPPHGLQIPPVQPGDVLDRAFRYQISRFTAGLSPFALAEAYFDWLLHLIGSPGRQNELQQKFVTDSIKVTQYLAHCGLCGGRSESAPCAAPHPNDKRFTSADWHTFPFNAIHQSFLLTEQWWHLATTGIRGVSEHHARVMEFASRQILDVFSPSNFLLTNPDALKRTQAEGGKNLVRGFWNAVEDWERSFNNQPPVGVDG
jgi:polyhydroxyalkanoate synthase